MFSKSHFYILRKRPTW